MQLVSFVPRLVFWATASVVVTAAALAATAALRVLPVRDDVRWS